MSEPLPKIQHDSLLETLHKRFEGTMPYHPNTHWETVLAKLEQHKGALNILAEMEATGGEPNIVDDPEHPDAIVFMDCAAETPEGRRNLCYDQEALLSRKKFPPKDSAEHMAETMGITLLSEAQYQTLQSLSAFDQKTSSWVKTPADVRSRGGALFCDRRFGRVFTYHNGADSYYGVRGFRGYLAL